tara:strand:- start:141 stop:845 length:705 start_codon:yes stop_codon:yes gene_type:complete
MEIVTLMATATASYNAVKRAISAGQELESMIGSLSKWMSCLSDIDQAEREAKHPGIFKKLFFAKTVEQEALEIFAAKQKAKQQRDELRQYIGLTMGMSKWNELVATEAKIRKQRQQTLYAQRERRQKFVEIVAWTALVGVGIAVLTAFVLLLKAHTARASDWANDLTTCRLVKCMKIDKRTEACVFRGAHNSQETLFFDYGEWKPREYLCQWKPDQPPPPNVYDVLEAIKDSQN